MDDPATCPTTSMHVDDAALRRSTVALVKSSLLALVLVAAIAMMVAAVVLRTPAAAVDPTRRQEPVGVARAAPNDLAMESGFTAEPPVVGVGGDPPAVTALPLTVMARDTVSQALAPTPTPLVMSLPTVAATTQPPRMAAAGMRSGEYRRLHLGPFSSFGVNVNASRATAAQAVPIATPTAPAAPPGTLEVGTRVVVTVPSARLRSAPSLDGLVVAGLPQGRALVVTGPPVAGSGYLWYPVEVRKEPGLVGYVAANLIAPKAS